MALNFSMNTPIFLDKQGCITDKITSNFAFIVDNKSPQYENIRKIITGNEKLCKGNVASQFINYSVANCDLIFTLFNNISELELKPNFDLSNTRNFRLYSFSSCFNNHSTDKSLYIDIICANPSARFKQISQPGKVMLNLVTEYAYVQGFEYVSLSALANVINYYRKFGFRHINSYGMQENEDITRLALLNRENIVKNNNDIDTILKIEYALQVFNNLDNPDDDKLKEYIATALNLPELDDYQLLDYLGMLPSHSQNDGKNGIYDFIMLLDDFNFFNTPLKRKSITRRSVDTKYLEEFIDNMSNGFIMRKPLFEFQEKDTGIYLDEPIVNCKPKTPSVSLPKSHSKSGKNNPKSLSNSLSSYLSGKRELANSMRSNRSVSSSRSSSSSLVELGKRIRLNSSSSRKLQKKTKRPNSKSTSPSRKLQKKKKRPNSKTKTKSKSKSSSNKIRKTFKKKSSKSPLMGNLVSSFKTFTM